MKDTYPGSRTFPIENLVEQSLQPDYTPPATGDVPLDANVGLYLADATRGSKIAGINAGNGTTLSYEELATQSNRIAAALIRLGVCAGDRVAYRSPNVIEVLPVLCGIWKAGGVVVPIPLQSTKKDIRFYIEDTAARFLMAHSRSGSADELDDAIEGTSLEAIIIFGDDTKQITSRYTQRISDLFQPGDDLFEAVQLEPNAIAIVWHTGGTTGTPKGCYHTHRRFLLGGFALGIQTAIQPDERWLAAAPIGHALGIIYNTIYTLLHGATAVMVEQFADPINLLTAVRDHEVDVLTALSPSWAKMLVALDADSSLPMPKLKRAFAMWQSASSSQIYDRWLSSGIELLNNFGSTSFATWVLTPVHGQSSPRGALGRPLPGYQVEAAEVVDGKVVILPRGQIGQMAVRGPTGLTYWNRPVMQKRDVVDGWTLQDDLIQYDKNGHVHYLGRTDYMISTGGYKVAPAEVEEVLTRHRDVHEVAVVPGPCPTNLEMVVAYVVLHHGVKGSPELAKALREYVKSHLVSYKAPRRIEFVAYLPRDAVGKVQTKIVKQWAAVSLDAQSAV